MSGNVRLLNFSFYFSFSAKMSCIFIFRLFFGRKSKIIIFGRPLVTVKFSVDQNYFDNLS